MVIEKVKEVRDVEVLDENPEPSAMDEDFVESDCDILGSPLVSPDPRMLMLSLDFLVYHILLLLTIRPVRRMSHKMSLHPS